METYNLGQSAEKFPTQEEVMEDYYRKISDSSEQGAKRISLEQLSELKEKGITTEKFLDYLCQNHGVLLHGSITEISDGRLKSGRNKIYASNKSAIAIMRSLYSNVNAKLVYPYFFDNDDSLVLKVYTQGESFGSQENGYVYVVSSEGFQNEPKGSWQFLKECDEVQIDMIIETEKVDFNYPFELFNNLDSSEKTVGNF